MCALERAHACSLDEVLGVVPVARNAKRECPQSRQHIGKHAW
jgi:hypothetical protein